MIKNGRLLSTARYSNEVKNAFLLALQKFKLIKTTRILPSNIMKNDQKSRPWLGSTPKEQS